MLTFAFSVRMSRQEGCRRDVDCYLCACWVGCLPIGNPRDILNILIGNLRDTVVVKICNAILFLC
ncbi:hypothetical protein HanRHA438_Chr11g0523861 [Helianthus annuus]|uniref:Uncharacterized protein n=1 Tax=Helianthus annuus TaxID=4232 RepID=A0A9K3HSK0_HELAN|nr:hypothetical protein HanXRQr2_Chr11g0511621 [Helianthus annuus]KAJ0503044.1 hypothetical protein HanHA300_Chr11g0419771 [Helianthus annuus]KAJ0511275.1 hypothetical protein HanIR_Chr11g0550111 [Helianthus annuus]KAJ0519006.1 hypothetical protein HanHA89_Chr11g0443781 [Helianthus annuus]KAJ0687006.1 hypothetical protein HanLR1_Chr11g0421071 [Helianthus annuus]